VKISLKYEDGVEKEIECNEFVLIAWNGDLERRGPAVVHCSGDNSIPEPRLEIAVKVLAEALASSLIPRAKALGMLLTASYTKGLEHLDDFLSKSVLEG
jgi:hypothetical protein